MRVPLENDVISITSYSSKIYNLIKERTQNLREKCFPSTLLFQILTYLTLNLSNHVELYMGTFQACAICIQMEKAVKKKSLFLTTFFPFGTLLHSRERKAVQCALSQQQFSSKRWTYQLDRSLYCYKCQLWVGCVQTLVQEARKRAGFCNGV